MKKQWQPPKYWQDFEAMCHLLFEVEWRTTQGYLYGRVGQAQNGVDIALRTSDAVHWTGIQCKLKTELLGGTLTQQELINAHTESRRFHGRLEKLYIATTSERDRNLQDLARTISESWQQQHPVELMFWDDIENLLDQHQCVANRYYPEAFAPENSLNARDDGELSITLQPHDYTKRLILLFEHSIFRAVAGAQHGHLMLIISELVDNLFGLGKGRAARVSVVLSGQVLTVNDDGVPFDSMNVPIPADAIGGLSAIRKAFAASAGQLSAKYAPKDGINTAYNVTRIELAAVATVQRSLCSAAGPATYLLNRDEASKFVRNLDIANECSGFTLRLYAENQFANFSAASQLLVELRRRLNGRPLTLKMGRESAAFVFALQYAADHYPDVIIEFV